MASHGPHIVAFWTSRYTHAATHCSFRVFRGLCPLTRPVIQHCRSQNRKEQCAATCRSRRRGRAHLPTDPCMRTTQLTTVGPHTAPTGIPFHRTGGGCDGKPNQPCEPRSPEGPAG